MQNSVTYMRQSRILHQANNTHRQTCSTGKSNALDGKICNKTDYLQFRLGELKNDCSKSTVPRFISMFRDKRRIIRDLLHGLSNNVVTYEATYVPQCLVARKSRSCKDNSATLYEKRCRIHLQQQQYTLFILFCHSCCFVVVITFS